MSGSWSAYVIALAVINLAACAWLLFVNRKTSADESGEESELQHTFDGIGELNTPLPGWWTWLFIGTLGAAVVYLVLYPGLGRLPGALGWTSDGQWREEVARADARYGPIYAAYYERSIPDLLGERRAVEMGGRLFANNCPVCHGSDAGGGPGFPNRSDGDWIYGGTPERIVETITKGRNAAMPAWAAALGGEPGVKTMAQYVLGLGGRAHDAEQAAKAAPNFAMICAACHGKDGTGNQQIGSPNLTDDIWLFGGRVEDIEYSIRNGRMSKMPAHGELLGNEKIHLLALYVYSLSHR